MTDAELERRRLRAAMVGRAAVVFAIIVTLALIATLGALLLNIRDQARSNAALAESARQQAVLAKRLSAKTARLSRGIQSVAHQLEDCLVDTGKCYRKQSARTGEAVGSITTLAFYAAACADRRGVQSEAQIRKCAARLLDPPKPGDQ